LAGDTKVLEENLPHYQFAHHKSHMTLPGLKPSHHGGQPATNCLSYGMAIKTILVNSKVYSENQLYRQALQCIHLL
jgi:hypothetical protein